MELAIQLAKLGHEDIKVGAVLVKNDVVIGKGYRGQQELGQHAEQAALNDARSHGINPKNAIVYTTLEPCVKTKSECAQSLIQAEVSEVVIGRYDPKPDINREGWKLLRDAGIKLRDFDADLRTEIDIINATFIGFFKEGSLDARTGAKFDYTGNGGKYTIYFGEDDHRYIETRWGRKGKKTIWARKGPGRSNQVAKAKFAKAFDDIDDPTAYDFESSSVGIDEGEISIFKSEHGCALVKVDKVRSGPPYDHEPVSVKIEFEIRAYEECGKE